MAKRTTITVARGDGIGPEIMDATLHIIQSGGAELDFETIEIGEKVYIRGNSAGIEQSSWDSLRKTKVFLKAPITTPQGGGFKSLNVTTRKMLGLYANVRPCVAYHPYVDTRHSGMDVVIVRENEEDVYGGIEHRQSADVTQCLKLISRGGCERIVRYAFEYALRNNRKKVTCFTKDNIMKITDGLFHKVFDEVASGYPDITSEHWIVDIGAAKLADTPEAFDVVVMPNLYGDILSDVAAQIAGSVGLAGSANIGAKYAMFEAIHGSAPRRAGQNIANPSGLLMGAVMMLVHIGQPQAAERVHNAWLKTIEDGIHTCDIYTEAVSKQKVGTKEFAEAVVKNLGGKPEKLKPVSYASAPGGHTGEQTESDGSASERTTPVKTMVGVDVFLDWNNGTADELASSLQGVMGSDLDLIMIDNRGTKVWPSGFPDTLVSPMWRCRFMSKQGPSATVTHEQIVGLLGNIRKSGYDFIKIESLCNFDAQPGYSLGQGQ